MTAYAYTHSAGIESAASYPYTGVKGTCKYNAANVVFHNSG
jgi:hypothetical protein